MGCRERTKGLGLKTHDTKTQLVEGKSETFLGKIYSVNHEVLPSLWNFCFHKPPTYYALFQTTYTLP